MFSIRNILQLICLVLMFSGWCEAKVYTQCEFAQAMYNQGVTNHADLGTWTCIAYQESRFNTQAINTQTWDYGILQISSLYWCSDSDTPGKDCGITCQSLLGDDITEDIVCARHVFDVTVQQGQNGFSAWTTYGSCTGDQTGWISGCGL